ncbi:hypothetical protein C2G38_2054599 [Gigaspora rosea]|uniref:Uncharacterized protein n=1 Tax=Gigaspora rosea TaxID=44941 RepID=A0A397WBM5_9GLOM|nr:hypothetical protein C2G38_2054599 [Gigaspora rosea]
MMMVTLSIKFIIPNNNRFSQISKVTLYSLIHYCIFVIIHYMYSLLFTVYSLYSLY